MGDVDRVDEIIKSYISESEWLELADAVRDRHRQMYLNYLELAKIRKFLFLVLVYHSYNTRNLLLQFLMQKALCQIL